MCTPWASRLATSLPVDATKTVADVCVVPQLYNARRFGVELEAYPALLRVEAACAVHPAFIEAHPDNQPDADPNA